MILPLKTAHNYLAQHQCDALLLPHTDPYQGEYLVSCDESIQWLTGFSGSAGFCIATRTDAAVFVDGRYTIQAAQQVDTQHFGIQDLGSETTWLKTWIASQENSQHLSIAYDPWCMSMRQRARFENILGPKEKLTPHPFMMHAMWHDRPDHPKSPLFHHPFAYTGESNASKCENVAQILRTESIDAYVFGPESWSWLLNVRGGDLHYTPVSQGFAFMRIRDAGVDIHLFVHTTDQSRLAKDIAALHAKMDPDAPLLEALTFHDVMDFAHFLEEHRTLTLGYDPSFTPVAIVDLFSKTRELSDPCILPRAIKNSTEITGARQAHIKDARAFQAFRTHFDQDSTIGKTLTELDIVERLLHARQAQAGFQSPSFDTIAGYGAHGAIVHYKPDAHSNRIIEAGSFLLIDSGGQYLEGTTDVTRTLAIGTPTHEMRFYYTLVLKAHIALARMIFPANTPGPHLDAMARKDLWAHGLDFAHGTGHGVGSFLSVHEGPQRISPINARSQGLVAGMIVSIEPGLYFEGRFGIRLENLVVVQPAHPQHHPLSDVITPTKEYLCFEPLTLIPFEDDLIIVENLSPLEQDWLTHYQDRATEIL